MSKNEILILDEPTVGLDPNQILEIRKLVKGLSKHHTVIISSHILSEIQAMCDRVVIINKGKVAAIDTITDLSKKLSGKSKLLLSFKGPLNDVMHSLRTVPGVLDVKSRTSDENGIHEIEIMTDSSLGSDLRSNIFYTMAKGGWPILEFRSIDATLEEVFLNITSH